MRHRARLFAMTAATCVCAAAGATTDGLTGLQALPEAFASPRYTTTTTPGGDRVTSVHGSALATGSSASESAARFVASSSEEIWSVAPESLRPLASDRRRPIQPLLHDASTGDHRFDLVTFEQWVDGLRVHNSELRVLVRRDTGHPAVLARASLHDLDGFRVTPLMRQKVVEAEALHASGEAVVGPISEWSEPSLVVYAGTDRTAPATLAFVMEGRFGTAKSAPVLRPVRVGVRRGLG